LVIILVAALSASMGARADEAPPQRADQTPPAETPAQPPPQGSAQAPPSAVETPPPQPTIEAPPPQPTTQTPPPQSTTQTPPPQSTTQAPPPQATTQAPPPQATTQAPPPQSTTQTSPPQSTTQTPPQSAVQSVAPEEAEAILGQRVMDQEGKDIGRLVDVLVDANGQPQAAVIDFGGFMGVGNRKIAVHWSTLRFNPGDLKHKVTLEMTPDQIKAAPEFLNPDKAAPVVTPASAAPTSP
jgi:hypothetical protein